MAKILMNSIAEAAEKGESELFTKVTKPSKKKKATEAKKEKKMKPLKVFTTPQYGTTTKLKAGRTSSRGTTQAFLDLNVGESKIFPQRLYNVAPIASIVGSKYKRQYTGQTIWPNCCEYKRVW